jgi:UDP-MurNAc hydroxylase
VEVAAALRVRSGDAIQGCEAMRLGALGHAGLAVATETTRVLVDPWFDPHGAFLGSWFPYPDNSVALTPEVLDPDAVVVTHEHFDHLDPWFLAQLAPTVPVVVCQFPSFALRDKILAAGEREIVELPPWERHRIGDVSVFFVPEESPMNHDAAVVVTHGDEAVVDLNDARLSPAQLREIRREVGGRVDVLLLQGAGASWYPICYEYPPERRRELSAQKRAAKLNYMVRAVGATGPRVAVPFAGPPCFLDPALAVHNQEMDEGIFPDLATVAAWLQPRVRARVEVLLPGDAWDLTTTTREPEPSWHDFDWSRRGEYLAGYAARRRTFLDEVWAAHPEPARALWPEFHAYFERLLAMNRYFLERIDLRVGFDLSGPGGGRWSVDLRAGAPAVHPVLEDCQYVYRFDARWLPAILDGTIGWEDFLLSLRFSAARDPDVYNDHLLGILKFATPSALAAVERFETSIDVEETITVTAGDRRYRVQRWCPHAGHDLSETGQVLPGGVLQCLAHHYEFDLDSGQCLTGACPALRTERLSDEPQPARPA